MKYLILIILSINTALACNLSIPMSDVSRALNPPVSGAYLKCEDFPNEECICIEKANTWYAELKEEIINGSPVYSPKENVVECAEDQCKELGPTHCEAFPDYQFFYAATSIGLGFEAYCAKLTGYEQVNTGKHVLVESAAKKAAYIQAQADKEGLTRQEIIDLKASFDILLDFTELDAATNLNQHKAVTKDKIKKIVKALKFFMREMKGE